MFVQRQNFGVNERLQFNFQLNGYDFPAHIHQFAELCYMMSGELSITVNGRLLTLCEGDYMFISPLCVHGYSTAKSCDALVTAFPTTLLPEVTSVWSFVIGKQAASNGAAEYFESLFLSGGLGAGKYSPIDPAHPSCAVSYFLDLADQTQRIRVRSALGALFAECEVPANDDHSPDTDSLTALLIWLGDHYTEPITLSDAASALGYSANYLSHRVKKSLGMSFPEILANLRVERCIELLGRRDMTTTAAALECGFDTERSFYRAFRKITGTTPGEYQKGKQND